MKFGFGFPSHSYNVVLNKDDFLDHKKTGKSFKDITIHLMRDKAIMLDCNTKEKKEVLNNLYFMDDKGEMQHVQFLNIIIED